MEPLIRELDADDAARLVEIYSYYAIGTTFSGLTNLVLRRNQMSNHKEKALSYFADKYHCSQAVLAAYAEECEISEEQALKLGSCFGSGMRKGEVCGACTGALMVLGLLYGQSKKADADERQRADKVNDMMTERFKEMNESYICKELLGCDVRTPEGLKYALDKNLFTEFCPKMVASAVTILDGIIEEMNAKETAE